MSGMTGTMLDLEMLMQAEGKGTVTPEELHQALANEQLIKFNAKNFVNGTRTDIAPPPPVATTVQDTSSTQRSKLTTKFLKYPTTVGQMQDGHYIIFEVHDITKPKLTKTKNLSQN